MHKSPYDPVFELSAKTDGDVLRICAAYNGGRDATDMVVIEAELLSGYNFLSNSYSNGLNLNFMITIQPILS